MLLQKCRFSMCSLLLLSIIYYLLNFHWEVHAFYIPFVEQLDILLTFTEQKLGGNAMLVDAEHAFDPSYSKSLGVDVENLIVCQPDNGEMALESNFSGHSKNWNIILGLVGTFKATAIWHNQCFWVYLFMYQLLIVSVDLVLLILFALIQSRH